MFDVRGLDGGGARLLASPEMPCGKVRARPKPRPTQLTHHLELPTRVGARTVMSAVFGVPPNTRRTPTGIPLGETPSGATERSELDSQCTVSVLVALPEITHFQSHRRSYSASTSCRSITRIVLVLVLVLVLEWQTESRTRTRRRDCSVMFASAALPPTTSGRTGAPISSKTLLVLPQRVPQSARPF